MSDKHIQESHGGLEFYDDEGVHRVMLKRTNDLSSDVYVNLPSESGTLATQEYVAQNSGSAGVVKSYRTSNLTRTSTSLVADTDMAVAVEANSVYRVEVYLEATRVSPSYLKFDFTGPSGASLAAIGTSDGGNQVYAEIGAAVSFTSLDYTVSLTGRLTTTDAGTLGLSWGVTTGSGSVTLYKGSHIVITKLD